MEKNELVPDYDGMIDEMCTKQNAERRELTKGEAFLLEDLVDAQFKRDEYKRLCEKILADPVWQRPLPIGPWWLINVGVGAMPILFTLAVFFPQLAPAYVIAGFIAGCLVWGAARRKP